MIYKQNKLGFKTHFPKPKIKVNRNAGFLISLPNQKQEKKVYKEEGYSPLLGLDWMKYFNNIYNIYNMYKRETKYLP